MIGAPVLVVVLVIAAFLVIKANQKPAVATGAPSAPAGSTLENSIKNVPASTFDAGGKGTGVNPPTVISGAALTANGKPRVLYIGAEFCPYCAAERWAMITALSGSGPSPISGSPRLRRRASSRPPTSPTGAAVTRPLTRWLPPTPLC